MAAVLEMLDPAGLLVDANIRSDLGLDAPFVDSIRQLGVLVPVVALRCTDGIRVRAGNRRTVAAVEAGLAHIPVMVLDDTDEDTDRIVEQLVENTQRAGLSTADTIAAVEQLALLGVSPTSIAKRTSLPKQHVTEALAAARSPLAVEAVEAYEALTLEHAGWLAEFDDNPAICEELLDEFTGDLGKDRHAVERARDRHTTERARQALAERISADTGGRLYTGDYYNDPDTLNLRWLSATPGGPELLPENHLDCPGNVFTLERRDFGTPDEIQDGIGFRVTFLCDNWQAHGHHDTRNTVVRDQQDGAPPEDKTQERRRTIALNRAGEAAMKVRREWLTEFTARKSSPKDAPAFMWAGLAADHVAAVQDAPWGLDKVEEILHIPSPRSQPAAAATWLAGQSQARLAHLLLCARLWSYEHRCSKEVWRQAPARDYLRALEQWGYTLSDVEKVCTGDLTEDAAYQLIGGH